MQRLSKRKGVISVFLLLIFMVTYVFMGLLVDAGRYRIAEVYAEAALDAASESVLSNYNRLMFEMYGLMSLETDGANAEEITQKMKALYEHYLEETLGLVDADVEDYRAVLLDSVFRYEDTGLGTKQLYDFQMTQLEVGTKVTLADTANVESQIIEYMKFRAPVELVSEMDGFLKKLEAMVGMKERIAESLKLAELTEKYEEPADGSDSLSKQAQDLLKEIHTYVVRMYTYSMRPDIPPHQLLNQNAGNTDLGNGNPAKITDYLKGFDEQIRKVEEEYDAKQERAEESYVMDLSILIGDLRNAITDSLKAGNTDIPDIKLDIAFSASGTQEKTFFFSEIDYAAWDEEPEHSKRTNYRLLSEKVYDKIKTQTKIAAYQEFCDEYVKVTEDYENEIKAGEHDALQQYGDADSALLEKISNIEVNAAVLHQEAIRLRDSLNQVVALYQAYIEEMEREQKKGENQNRKTVYAPAIECAQANMAELLKNLDILMNSRPYLDELGYGFQTEEDGARQKLSELLPGITGKILTVREDYYILAKEISKEDQKYIVDTPLENEVGGDADAKWKTNAGAEGIYRSGYQAVYVDLAQECVSGIQGNICVLNSFTSYYRNSHYRRDVDVRVEDLDTTMNTQDAKDRTKGSDQDTEKEKALKLDNEAMLRAADYPDYLKVEYEHSAAQTDTETDTEYEMENSVGFGTMKAILKKGLNVLDALGNLLETARDNLYLDAYAMTMLPNYYDYNRYNDGKQDGISSAAFSKEYLDYNSSFAAVEYIITGAGGATLKAAENGEELAKGYGQFSVEAMRMKLFGTRLLFNGVAMFTDTAKYTQASVLCSWMGPLAPLATVVMMAAWAVAETVIDVMVLMGEDAGFLGNAFPEDGKIPIFKQGADWFFSLEGVAGKLAGLAINTVTDRLKSKAAELTNSAKQELNLLIYQAYISASADAEEILNEIKTDGSLVLESWSNELEENIGKLPASEAGRAEAAEAVKELSGLSGSFAKEVDQCREQVATVLGDAHEKTVAIVTRISENVLHTVDQTLDKAGKTATSFLTDYLDQMIPVGEVVNTGKTTDVNLMMGYQDYLYFFLFLTGNTKKVERIQSVLQANMRVGGREGYLMKNAPVSVWADMECSMKFLFLSNGLVPESMKQNNRLRIKVISAQSY